MLKLNDEQKKRNPKITQAAVVHYSRNVSKFLQQLIQNSYFNRKLCAQ